MCYLASQQGAKTLGMDINRDYISQANSLFPELSFLCKPIEELYGNYDLIIASAMLHYIKDLDSTLLQLSRCAKKVLCDVWLHDSQVPIFALTHRDIFIPSKPAFLHLASKYFLVVEELGPALSPDSSSRYIYHLSEPKPNPANATIIYGEGGTGKTTLSRTFFNSVPFSTDWITLSWYRANRDNWLSVKWASDLNYGLCKDDFITYFINFLSDQLESFINRDIVLEGYDLLNDGLREQVIKLLSAKGWLVNSIYLTKHYPKDYK
jgi:hypothetical protein